MKTNKGGRPREDLAKKVDFKRLKKLAALGLTDEQLAGVFDVTRETINQWKKDKRFSLHLKKGKNEADEKVVQSLFSRATGIAYDEETKEAGIQIRQVDGQEQKYLISPDLVTTKIVKKFIPPDTTACIFWLTNRDKENWKHRHTLEGNRDNPIQSRVIVEFPDVE